MIDITKKIRVIRAICGLFIALSLLLLSSSFAYSLDIMDDSFGIFSENERGAFKDFNVSTELKKAAAEAAADRFDAAVTICRKLLKNTNLSMADKKEVKEKIADIESKRSTYLASKAREEEEKRKAAETGKGALREKRGLKANRKDNGS